jgi:hypothetical protein
VIRNISIVSIGAAMIAALIGALTWPGEAQQRTPAENLAGILTASVPPLFDQSYTAGMRIIHVPQGDLISSYPRASNRTAALPDDDVEIAPPPKPRKQAAPPQPRRVLPPAGTQKRTMLNVPSPADAALSPIRPTPRWRSIEKFTDPPRPVATAAPVQADPVVAPIPTEAAPSTEFAAPATDQDMPAIDDDTPPPTD